MGCGRAGGWRSRASNLCPSTCRTFSGWWCRWSSSCAQLFAHGGNLDIASYGPSEHTRWRAAKAAPAESAGNSRRAVARLGVVMT